MGLALSALTRRLKRFNIENRAHREISKEKPRPAPAYPSTLKEIERIKKENPEILKEYSQKNAELHDRLKEVYLISHDAKVETTTKTTEGTRPLPLNRSAPKETDFGFFEPAMIPKGRVSVRQALKFIAEHQSDPSNKTSSTIAAEYNLGMEITENILKYFKTFEIFVPDNKKEQVAGGVTTITQIESGKAVKDDK